MEPQFLHQFRTQALGDGAGVGGGFQELAASFVQVFAQIKIHRHFRHAARVGGHFLDHLGACAGQVRAQICRLHPHNRHRTRAQRRGKQIRGRKSLAPAVVVGRRIRADNVAALQVGEVAVQIAGITDGSDTGHGKLLCFQGGKRQLKTRQAV